MSRVLMLHYLSTRGHSVASLMGVCVWISTNTTSSCSKQSQAEHMSKTRLLVTVKKHYFECHIVIVKNSYIQQMLESIYILAVSQFSSTRTQHDRSTKGTAVCSMTSLLRSFYCHSLLIEL